LNSANEDDFNKELASLLSFQEENFKHLIRLLVTFEITSAKGTTFYLVFPWAQGNLWDFWKTYQEINDRTSRCDWMANQSYGLAKALMEVHNERDRHLPEFDEIEDTQYELYGRHGDVKAENILWYKKDDTLVMSDFGLGRLHSKLTRSGLDPKTIGGTETYRAPEFDTKEGRISRASDIFSLGCMLLEFVTWNLEGWQSVDDEFPNHRMEAELARLNFESDTFFQIEEGPKGQETPIIKHKVREWIDKLKQNPKCSYYHIQFLDLIEKRMLNPNPKDRIRSPALVDELEILARGCEIDEDYYLEPANWP
jgi:serine/threonine protein kinase